MMYSSLRVFLHNRYGTMKFQRHTFCACRTHFCFVPFCGLAPASHPSSFSARMAHRRHTAGSRWSVEWAHSSWVTAVLAMAITALHARVGEALKVGNEVFLKGQFIQVRQTQPRSLPWVTRLSPLTPRTPAPFSCQAPRCLPLKMSRLSCLPPARGLRCVIGEGGHCWQFAARCT
jgi:hypothetical protein